jgi:hypothetical protein
MKAAITRKTTPIAMPAIALDMSPLDFLSFDTRLHPVTARPSGILAHWHTLAGHHVMPESIRRTTEPAGQVSLSGGFMSPLSARLLDRRNAEEIAARAPMPATDRVRRGEPAVAARTFPFQPS